MYRNMLKKACNDHAVPMTGLLYESKSAPADAVRWCSLLSTIPEKRWTADKTSSKCFGIFQMFRRGKKLLFCDFL